MSKISRRALLRGIGGVAIGLPVLEVMLDRHGERIVGASGATMPTRYAILFAGQSIGGDNWEQNRSRIAGTNVTQNGDFIAPPQVAAATTSRRRCARWPTCLWSTTTRS